MLRLEKNSLLVALLSIMFWSNSGQAHAQWSRNWWNFDAKPFSQRTAGQKTATIVIGTLLAGAGIMLIDYVIPRTFIGLRPNLLVTHREVTKEAVAQAILAETGFRPINAPYKNEQWFMDDNHNYVIAKHKKNKTLRLRFLPYAQRITFFSTSRPMFGGKENGQKLPAYSRRQAKQILQNIADRLSVK